MKLLNAFTLELDSSEIAVSEILAQLDLENNARKHCAGFITCSYDFVETGIVRAICDALPFDVVGCTTLTNANNREADAVLLCLTVLTADDCRFAAALSEPLDGDMEGAIGEAARRAMNELGEPAKLSLAFLPMSGIAGENMLTALDEALGGTPIFGTIACDIDTAAYSNSHVFYNGEARRNSASFLLISGNVNPRFVIASTSEQNTRKQQAVITSSEGSLLKRVNNMTATEYFVSLGLTSGAGVEGMSSVPFVVDYNDGTQPAARAIYSLNADGSAVGGGHMPEGGSLSIGQMDARDILLTADSSTRDLLGAEGVNGLILFPCLGRYMALALDPMAEIAAVQKVVGDAIPTHLAYSGGECCPVYTKDGQTENRFHNFTFIGCAL